MTVNKKFIYSIKLLSDLFLLDVTFVAAAILAQSFSTLIQHNTMFILLAVLNLIWYFSSNITRLYDETTSRYLSNQIIRLGKNLFLLVFTSIVFIFLMKEQLFTRNFIIYFTLIFSFSVAIRIILVKQFLVSLIKKGINKRNVLVIGKSEAGLNFKEIIEKNPEMGYNFTRFVESDNKIHNEIISDIDNELSAGKTDEAVIALPNYAFNLLDDIIKTCNKYAVKVHIIPDYFRFVSQSYAIDMIGHIPIISVRTEPLEEIQWRILKRAFDILFSLVVILTVLIWLVPLFYILYKIRGEGKLFFVQKRIGVKNKQFDCYKFKTMKNPPVSVEDEFHPVVANDPRITRLGKFLRKSNIDELPQFLNVLKGDMSIVGPRPHAIAYHLKYKEIVQEIQMRHNVKPGITGWAQIHGLRGDVQDEEENNKRTKKRIEYDIWYIENWSFLLDIQIIFTTVWQMVTGNTKGR